MNTYKNFVITIGLVALALAGCSTTELGRGSSMVTGSANESGNATGAAPQLPHCNAHLGTIALVESQWPALAQHGLTSPVPLVRLMAAQSGCFTVIERGQALTRMTEERGLADSGLLQKGANVGRGQMVAADYYITPNVVFAEDNAGGAVAELGSFLPGYAGLLSRAIGSVKFREAQAMLTITDTRTGVQTGIAEGSARASDLGGGLGLGGLRGFGGLSGYSNTNEGKVVAGAFLDAFGKLVEQIRTLRGK